MNDGSRTRRFHLVIALVWEPVLITSNSMAPQIRAGDLVPVAPTPPDLATGSVIMFDSGGHAITHRIVAINADHSYVTQGDGNPLPDSTPVAPEAVIGAPRLMVSTIGMPLLWLRQGDWVLAALCLFATVAAGSYLIGSAQNATDSPADRGRPKPGFSSRLGRAIRSGGGKTALVLIVAGSVVVGVPAATGAFSDVAANSANTYTASDWETIVGLAGGEARPPRPRPSPRLRLVPSLRPLRRSQCLPAPVRREPGERRRFR
jgi:signal peptidase I